ncbi:MULTISPECIES: hypothetical protein [unclassified Labrenzia]|jgi:hypothetical protein|uniref:hypothetical protein n=1 Tax=unclassified Labrenzia TaxID=2648686 RepID=UPI0004B73529|nr:MULTISPECIES: hypothetical protein [unclassified Labrenzia]
MSSFTCADYLAEILAGIGVSRTWGVTGDSLNGFALIPENFDAFINSAPSQQGKSSRKTLTHIGGV